MSGFTEGAKRAALEARDRSIFLMDGDDVDDLFSGGKQAKDQ